MNNRVAPKPLIFDGMLPPLIHSQPCGPVFPGVSLSPNCVAGVSGIHSPANMTQSFGLSHMPHLTAISQPNVPPGLLRCQGGLSCYYSCTAAPVSASLHSGFLDPYNHSALPSGQYGVRVPRGKKSAAGRPLCNHRFGADLSAGRRRVGHGRPE
jgi:hypothetical protein